MLLVHQSLLGRCWVTGTHHRHCVATFPVAADRAKDMPIPLRGDNAAPPLRRVNERP
jgi:hypothetical protein